MRPLRRPKLGPSFGRWHDVVVVRLVDDLGSTVAETTERSSIDRIADALVRTEDHWRPVRWEAPVTEWRLEGTDATGRELAPVGVAGAFAWTHVLQRAWSTTEAQELSDVVAEALRSSGPALS
jgi:hypothetical protein